MQSFASCWVGKRRQTAGKELLLESPLNKDGTKNLENVEMAVSQGGENKLFGWRQKYIIIVAFIEFLVF